MNSLPTVKLVDVKGQPFSLTIDGVPIRAVRDVTINSNYERATEVAVQFLAASVEVETSAVVNVNAVAVDSVTVTRLGAEAVKGE